MTNINHKQLLELEYLIPSVLSERTTCVYLFSDHISDRVKKQMALAGVVRANHLWLLTRSYPNPLHPPSFFASMQLPGNK